jgi:hypothetical protein
MEINNFPVGDAYFFLQQFQNKQNRSDSYLLHPYYKYITNDPNFVQATNELVSKGVIPTFEHENEKREYWLEFILVLTDIFIIYFQNLLDEGRTIPAKPISKPRLRKIEKHASELLDLLEGTGIFPEYMKNCHLVDLLNELKENISNGSAPEYNISRLNKDYLAREILIKLLVTRNYIQYRDIYSGVVCILASIVDNDIDERAVQRFVKKMRPELEQDQKWIEENLLAR